MFRYLTKLARISYVRKVLRRIRDLQSLDGIGQPSPVEHLRFNKACVLAPHPDDETIGIGGFLHKFKDNVHVCCVTDGGLGISSKSSSEAAFVREAEFRSAMEYLGISTFTLLNGQDGLMAVNRAKLERFSWELYDLVAVPNWLDSHRDHVGLVQIILDLARTNKISPNTKILFYEVWSTLSIPTHFLDLTQSLQTKINAINIYQSQVAEIDYAETQAQLSRFRGQMCGVRAAEVYTVITASDLIEIWQK